MKLLSIILCVLLLSLYTFTWAEEVKLAEKTIDLGCNCQSGGYKLLKKLIGECAGNDFRSTDAVMDDYNKHCTAYVITNWEDFRRFQDERFQAPYFQNEISQQFFKQNSLGVVFAVTMGAGHIKNEKLSAHDGKCVFAYEIWEYRSSDPAPGCVWQSLYVFEIRKSGF